MDIDMQLSLKDVPGTLINVLKPISEHGGNIVSVLHSRGNGDMVPVHIKFRVSDEASLNLIKKALENDGIHILGISSQGTRYYDKRRLSFILQGHVIDSDIMDTIDRINAKGLVSGIDVAMSAPEDKSSVMFNVDADAKDMGRLKETIEEICKEKDFLLIRSLE